MESKQHQRKINFNLLQARLITHVNTRIQNGDFTERGLAKILSISQPQMHNVLKGARKLQPDLADRLLSKLEISLFDLFLETEILEEARFRASSRPDLFLGRPELPLDAPSGQEQARRKPPARSSSRATTEAPERATHPWAS